MKYLFFDIECATCKGGGKICEFGYVLVDRTFKVIKSELFIINPKSTFDHYVIKEMLALPKESYLSAKDYTHYYSKIKKLVTDDNVTVIGHTVESDAKYLADESKRFSLPFINFKFYDVKEMYMEHVDLKESVNLEKMGVSLGCDPVDHLHQADQDAILTMRCAKALCEKEGLKIEELLKKRDVCRGEVIDGAVTCVFHQRAKLLKEKRLKELIDQNLLVDESKRRFFMFVNGVERLEEIKSQFNGKKIAFNTNYESKHYKEMTALVQILKNHDAEYAHKASKADYFINLQGKGGATCPKLEAVMRARAKRKRIKIISIEELLKRLNVTENDLINTPLPDEKYYKTKRQIIKENLEYKEQVAVTVSDIISAKNKSKNS